MTILGIGELLWDCFGETRRPGGAPANVAFHAAQLGAGGIVCSRVGCDEAGDALIEYLRGRGMDCAMIQRDPVHPTGTVTVNTTQADHPSYIIHEDVAWDHITLDRPLEHTARCVSAVCFGTLAQRMPRARDTIQQCLRASGNAMLVYDVNLRPPWFTPESIDLSLQRCHVVKLNHSEVSQLADILGLPVTGMGKFAAGLRSRYGIRVVCITRGEDGCFIASGDTQVEAPGCRVDVRDAVGAGDAFTAALIRGLLWEWPLDHIARFANEVGALVASRAGAMPELHKEFDDLILRFG